LKKLYVLDACSLIALLTDEKGSNVVKDLLQKALNEEISLLMHMVNFLEVYYYICKRYDEKVALKFFEDIKISPIKLNAEITDNILIKAGRLKSLYKISLADSIGIAESVANNGYFVTSDHHEIDEVEKKEKLNIVWFR
jgi:predicted nucleic acid-binding protein